MFAPLRLRCWQFQSDDRREWVKAGVMACYFRWNLDLMGQRWQLQRPLAYLVGDLVQARDGVRCRERSVEALGAPHGLQEGIVLLAFLHAVSL